MYLGGWGVGGNVERMVYRDYSIIFEFRNTTVIKVFRNSLNHNVVRLQ